MYIITCKLQRVLVGLRHIATDGNLKFEHAHQDTSYIHLWTFVKCSVNARLFSATDKYIQVFNIQLTPSPLLHLIFSG